MTTPNPRTKTEQAYFALRRAIVVGELAEDTPLDDALLLDRYGFGRTPIREALKRLADEQFINFPPHRTPYVRGIKVGDPARLYEARHLLEEPIARMAAERVKPSQLEEMTRVVDRIDDEIAADRPYEAVELDHRFHLLVAEATDNAFLAAAVNRLNCGSLRIWYLAHSTLGMQRTNTDHRGIRDALTGGDAETAVALVRRHIKSSYARQTQLNRLDPVLPEEP